VQVSLGIFVGAKVTRETADQLKAMIPSALLIVIWTRLQPSFLPVWAACRRWQWSALMPTLIYRPSSHR